MTTYSKEELLELINPVNDPTWNAQRLIFTVKPSEAYLQRVDGKAPDVLTEDNLNRVYDHMMEGASLNEVCAILQITRQTLLRWCAKEGVIFEQLRDTIALGLIQSVAWWERKGREALNGTNGKYFKDHLYALHMMNKFGWLSGKSANQKTIEEVHTSQIKVDIPKLNDIKQIALKQEPQIIDLIPEVVKIESTH